MMLPRFTLLSRFLISASRNVRFSIKPGSYRSFLSLQYSCSCSHSSLYQQTSFDALKERLEKLNVSTIQSRTKSSRKRRSPEYESESDSDEEVQQILGSKVVQIQSESLRCDGILKLGLGLSRNKLEVLFYEGRVRINGKKIPKKSVDVQPGDSIDLIKEISEENPNFINVSRIEFVKARPTGDTIVITIRKHKTLLIENYESNPWTEPTPATEEEEK